ncbi:SusD/RagB family nutrient-binding outer membrane lipoprotein [Parapedobacter sp. ISTM3]|uniref:SusD/RagB family nutrient-binding outer membrane lipoprotein n=1 Tax=Parapedobacter sp. ISTM3 TaxID=2800130 RepID=UPI001907B1FF|nr:SusD/RagB family nutrient-binding outer membrane lipoprotein [Parapedobacter sp. ISTM3]MBK1439618.1 SusD/RagB family nutrient-binding outer membrane lipoprotein [Parapedobacter sp. ISTM3]
MNIKITMICAIILLTAGGCEKIDNTNPNVPSAVNPGVVLPQVLYSISNTLTHSAFEINNELIQYTCMNNTFTEVQRFKLQPSNSNQVWNLYNRLRDLNDINSMVENGTGHGNYAAISGMIRVFILSMITDAFGDVPYSEAGKATAANVFTPKYDTQEFIYKGLIDELQRYSQLIDVTAGLDFGGDLIYQGDMLKWKKFGNSLLLRLLMRTAERQPAEASALIGQILSDPAQYPVMESNADNFLYRYQGSFPDVFPLAPSYVRDFDFKYKSVSAFVVDSLTKFGDTRLYQFARPTNASANTANPVYVGLPNALPVTESANYNGGYNFQSYLGTRFQSDREAAIWMTASEVFFLKAEAAIRGFYQGDAQQAYHDGIKHSFDYWGAPFNDDYLAHPSVAFDGTLPKVYLQKYFSLFFTGIEAWSDYRRTGYPRLVPGPTNVNNGRIPSRLPYPLSEQSLNQNNYREASQRIGGDDMNSKMWWQN